MRLLIPHLVLIAMVVTGVVMLLFPEKIQQSAIRADRFEPFKSWTRSRAYIWSLKITGSTNCTGGQTISVSASWLAVNNRCQIFE
jgi:hypothetical protein